MKWKRTTMKMGALGAMALMLLVAFAGTTTVGCPPPPPPCDENANVILWAGQTIDVGSVMVWHDDVNLYVKYMLYPDGDDCGWYITESQLSVVIGTWEGHPQGPKNLKIGQFEFDEPTDDGPKYHLYVIPWVDIDGFNFGDLLDIAAHAVVMKVCDGEIVQGETAWGEGTPHWKNWAMSFSYRPCLYKVPRIPTGTISYTVSHSAYPAGTSYFSTTINSGGGGNAPDGTYIGWCIDLSVTIGGTNTGTLSMPSPGDANYCDWSKVNWILNHKGSYDWEVIQAAIWNTYLGTTITASMGTGIHLSPDQITDAEALAFAASDKCWFRAFTNDWVAVIVTSPGNQITIIEVDP